MEHMVICHVVLYVPGGSHIGSVHYVLHRQKPPYDVVKYGNTSMDNLLNCNWNFRMVCGPRT